MSRQESAAFELEQAAEDLAGFIDRCSESDWQAVASVEGWTVAALAYHCALGNDVAMSWICSMLDQRPVRETPETHDAFNAADASRHSHADRATVKEALRRSSARTVAFLRSLSDDELERSVHHGLAGREITVGRFIGNFGRHIRDHLSSLEDAVKS